MSGQSTCRDIAAIRERGKTDRAAIDAFGDAINPIKSIGKAISATNDSDNSVIGAIRQNFKNITDTLVRNNCDNISSLKQENIYKEPVICFTSMIDVCQNKITGETNLECLKEVTAFLKNRPSITQENKNVTNSLCEINAAIQVIANQEATAQNAAILQSMQEARGLLSSNKTDGLNCNEIDQNITSEQYLKVLLGCFQETSVKQSNIIDACHPAVTKQLNTNDDLKKCLLSAGILVSTSQTAGATNKSDLKTSQTAVGLDPAASLASLLPIVIICCILIVGAIFILPMLSGGSTSGSASGSE
jgi:hypothetical protein